MNKLINNIKSTYGHLSDRLIGYHDKVLEEYDRRQYMRFFKGSLIDNEAKVSLATACFYMGQGFNYIRGLLSGISSRIGSLRRVRRNRLK
jgi:hypothetical protein